MNLLAKAFHLFVGLRKASPIGPNSADLCDDQLDLVLLLIVALGLVKQIFSASSCGLLLFQTGTDLDYQQKCHNENYA